MKKRRWLFCSLVLAVVIIVACTFFWGVKIIDINSIPNQTYVSFDDVENINCQKTFGKFVDVELDKSHLEVGDDGPKYGKVVFKLFGLIPIKTVEVRILPEQNVFLGGNAVGFSIKTNGVIVVGKNSVLTNDGLKSVCEDKDIREGDIITHINGTEVKDVGDITECLSAQNLVDVDLTLKRGDKVFDVVVRPVVDSQSGTKKVGLWVRDDVSGIGTLTYVEDDYDFGALGHPITDGETGAKVDVQNGKMFACSIVGVEKGEKGNPGEIKGVFLDSKFQKGEITSGSDYGIFGKITDKAGIVDENVYASVGGRLAVKPGKAQIVSSVSGVREYYDIEIIKAVKQNSAKDRSLVFRVVDKKLLELTGGIIQGMSGSPIIQNGKLVGAVTHVFVSDPTKGYGVYIDWMMV